MSYLLKTPYKSVPNITFVGLSFMVCICMRGGVLAAYVQSVLYSAVQCSTVRFVKNSYSFFMLNLCL